MQTTMRWRWLVLWAVLLPASAHAQNPEFQSFFFDVCSSATGGLEDRCDETPGGRGDLSGDSEDSLNPSQTLNLNAAGLARARAAGKEAQERLEAKRGKAEEEEAAGAPRLGIFGHARAEIFDREETGLQRGVDGNSYGGQLGLDYRVSAGAVVGALFAYDRREAEFDSDDPGVNFIPPSNDGEHDSDHYGLTLYGSYNVSDKAYVEGSVGYAHTEYDFDRNAVFQESRRRNPQTNVAAGGDTGGDEWLASAAIGYDHQEAGLVLGPYARVNFVSSEVDGYTESGGSGLAMRIGGETQVSLTTVLGLRSSYAISTSWGVIVPQARFEYEHEFEKDRQRIETSFVSDAAGTSFRARGNAPDRDYFNAAIGVVAVLQNGWMPFVDYEALLGHSYLERHRVVLGLRKEF